jgi:lysophospholipase L1-like esterase
MSGNYVKAQANTSPVFTAIGDSISDGYSADTGKGYVDLLYNYLKVQSRYSGLQLNNLSIPGLTTTDLLNDLSTNTQFQNSIKNSNIITLSIGGNNLLAPVISTAEADFNINTTNDTNLLTTLSQDIKSIPEATRYQLYSQFINSSSQLPAELTAGDNQFISDFPNIIKQIKALAPQAKIYVLTIYNPFSTNDIYHNTFDQLIKTINSQIKSLSANNYEVVDVYTAFNNTYSTPVVNFNFLQGDIDPHPTNEGHEVIFETHVPPISSVTLNVPSNSLVSGQSMQLTATVNPVNPITDPDVIWKSSDDTIATVDQTGKVTGIKDGTVTITATAAVGSVTGAGTATSSSANIIVNALNNTSSYAILAEDSSGNYFQYDLEQLNSDAVNKILGLPSPLYDDFIVKQIIAYYDNKTGYIAKSTVDNTALNAVLAGNKFNFDTYLDTATDIIYPASSIQTRVITNGNVADGIAINPTGSTTTK